LNLNCSILVGKRELLKTNLFRIVAKQQVSGRITAADEEASAEGTVIFQEKFAGVNLFILA